MLKDVIYTDNACGFSIVVPPCSISDLERNDDETQDLYDNDDSVDFRELGLIYSH